MVLMSISWCDGGEEILHNVEDWGSTQGGKDFKMFEKVWKCLKVHKVNESIFEEVST